MKNFTLAALLLISFLSCQKNELNPAQSESNSQYGNIKVSINYTPSRPSSSFMYTLDGAILVELKKNEEVIATQYSYGQDNLDFGSYEYGTYRVRVEGRERTIRLSDGSSSTYDTFRDSETFELNNTTKSISFNL